MDIYRELRYLYRSIFFYRKPLAYVYNRFFTNVRIRRLFAAGRASPPAAREDYTVHFLTCHRDMDMLLWSLGSWFHFVPDSGKVYIHDDGTLTGADRELLKSYDPDLVIIDYAKSSEAVLEKLRGFPRAHASRGKSLADKRYVFNLKLIDPLFAGGSGCKLILDSDLLWFQRPVALLEALSQNRLPVFMGGFGEMDFKFSDGSVLPAEIAGVNSGIVGYRQDDFSLPVLEEFFARVGDDTNPHFVEQAGYAYILTRSKKPNFLPAGKYLIKGRVGGETAMKHYTSPRREQFWFEGVKLLKDKLL